jgi:hypothetical protein
VAAGSLRSPAAPIINAPQLSAIVRLRCLVSRPTRQGVTTNFGVDVLMEFRAALNVSLCERKGVLTDLLHWPGLNPFARLLIARQKLSEAIVVGGAAKSRFHAFPLHNGFLPISPLIASSPLPITAG